MVRIGAQDLLVSAHEVQVLEQRLGDEHPVERVRVDGRGGEGYHVVELDGQHLEPSVPY